MSQINQALWEAYFGATPMPEGCTYEQFVAARDKELEHMIAELETIIAEAFDE